jgi:hypothetical protein
MADVPVAPAVARPRSIDGRLNSGPELEQGIELFPAYRGGIYRVRAMEVNTPKFSNRELA